MSVRAISDLERGVNASAQKETARLLAKALDLDNAQADEFEAARVTAATGPRPVAQGQATAPEAQGAWTSRLVLIVLPLVAVLVGLGMFLVLREGTNGGGTTSSSDRPRPTDATATPGPAVYSAPVNGAGTPTVGLAETISLWTRPSSNSGCERSPCLTGTATAGMVRPGQLVPISCVVQGQLIRNGVPGEPGYYDDDRWLLVAEGQIFGQEPGQAVYLSNVYSARERLPADLPSCTG